MRNLLAIAMALFAWWLFVIASLNTIAFGVRYANRQLEANNETQLAVVIVACMYALWYLLISWVNEYRKSS